MKYQRLSQLGSFVALLIVWEVCAHAFEPRWLPPVSSIVVAGVDLVQDGRLLLLGSTAQTLLIGMVISFGAAAVLALIIASSDLIEKATDPFVNAALATPTLALIPVFILIWGYDDVTRIATVVSFALFPVVVTWAEGVKGVPDDLLEMSRAFTASRQRQLRSIVLPAAAPMIITGLRIGTMQGIKGVVSAEVIIGVIGIGQLLREAQFRLDYLYAVITILLILSVVVYFLLFTAETRVSQRTQAG